MTPEDAAKSTNFCVSTRREFSARDKDGWGVAGLFEEVSTKCEFK